MRKGRLRSTVFDVKIGANAESISSRPGDESSEGSLYKFAALLLVTFGSRERGRLTNLGNAASLPLRYFFDILL